MPGFMVKRGERALEGRTHDMAGGSGGFGVGAGCSGLRGFWGHGATRIIVWGAVSRHNMGWDTGQLPQLAHVGTIKRQCDTVWDAGAMKEKSVIALVDDERNILTSLGMALEAEGYKVRTYSDGAAALEALSEEPADLAILDIKMPRMDGMELLRRLRQQTDMPVIFLTSKDEEIDELFGLKMGADDYIAKPFSQRLVVERVKAVLRRFQPKDGGNTAAEAARGLERGNLRLGPRRPPFPGDRD